VRGWRQVSFLIGGGATRLHDTLSSCTTTDPVIRPPDINAIYHTARDRPSAQALPNQQTVVTHGHRHLPRDTITITYHACTVVPCHSRAFFGKSPFACIHIRAASLQVLHRARPVRPTPDSITRDGYTRNLALRTRIPMASSITPTTCELSTSHLGSHCPRTLQCWKRLDHATVRIGWGDGGSARGNRRQQGVMRGGAQACDLNGIR
jgi:hypothetical protein